MSLLNKGNVEYWSNRHLRGRTIMALDMVISLVSSLLAIMTVTVFFENSFYSKTFLGWYMAASAFGAALMFLLFRTYRVVIRHFGVKDLVPFAASFIIRAAFVAVVLRFAGFYSNWALLVVLIDAAMALFLVIAMRVAMILGYDFLRRRNRAVRPTMRVLVYGLSDKSIATHTRLQNSSHYQIIGFLERTDQKDSMTIERLPVYRFNDDEQLAKILESCEVGGVLYSRDTDAQAEENGAIKVCIKQGIKNLIIPGLDEMVTGQSIMRPREIKVEDLLGRKQIEISMGEIQAWMHGKTVLVTGAAGSIGSELVRQIAGFGVRRIILFDNAETPLHNLQLELQDKFAWLDFIPCIGDVRQVQRLDFAFRQYRPDVVFHAAAYKHVPLMELNPCEAVLVNVYGTRNVADKCIEYGVEKMVMVSTDKAVNPTSVMGCTKRLAEIYVQSLGQAIASGEHVGATKFVTTRFGNVLGSNGSVIPRFREQIQRGGPVTVTHPEINRYFMTIPEACHLVMEAAARSQGNEIFVFDMGEPVKIVDLARRMIILAGYVPDEDIRIEFTGLRPGEKLYEELLSNEENTVPSFHERIRIAKVRQYPYSEADAFVKEMERLSREVDIPGVLDLMRATVPEYGPEHKNTNKK